MARLTLIAAVSADGYLSRDQGVPWDLPRDRAHFRAYTHGGWLLLGRVTFEEMLGWFKEHHPLVLSRDSDWRPALGQRVSTVQEALALTDGAGQAELIVCGGGGAYAAAMPLADRLILTHVDAILGSGVAFPPFNEQEWTPVSQEPHDLDAEHAHSFQIVTYQRVHHYEHEEKRVA